MRLTLLGRTALGLVGALTLLTSACATEDSTDGGGAAHIGVVAEVEGMPSVTIDDEAGTEVRVFVHLDHMGGPDAETFEVVSAGLRLDLEPYADIELAIPNDHPAFPGLANGEEFDLELRGSLPDTHTDWGLCMDPQAEDQDELRLSLDLELLITPGANDDADEYLFESMAVELHCSYTG
jgi:hypothetical protein